MTLADVQETYLATLKALYYVVSEGRQIWSQLEANVDDTALRDRIRRRRDSERRRRARLEKIFWGLDYGRGAYRKSSVFERIREDVDTLLNAERAPADRTVREVVNRLHNLERDLYTRLRHCAERLGRWKDVELIDEAVEEDLAHAVQTKSAVSMVE